MLWENFVSINVYTLRCLPQRLGACQQKVDEEDYGSGRQDENISKNRYFNILPSEFSSHLFYSESSSQHTKRYFIPNPIRNT